VLFFSFWTVFIVVSLIVESWFADPSYYKIIVFPWGSKLCFVIPEIIFIWGRWKNNFWEAWERGETAVLMIALILLFYLGYNLILDLLFIPLSSVLFNFKLFYLDSTSPSNVINFSYFASNYFSSFYSSSPSISFVIFSTIFYSIYSSFSSSCPCSSTYSFSYSETSTSASTSASVVSFISYSKFSF